MRYASPNQYKPQIVIESLHTVSTHRIPFGLRIPQSKSTIYSFNSRHSLLICHDYLHKQAPRLTILINIQLGIDRVQCEMWKYNFYNFPLNCILHFTHYTLHECSRDWNYKLIDWDLQCKNGWNCNPNSGFVPQSSDPCFNRELLAPTWPIGFQRPRLFTKDANYVSALYALLALPVVNSAESERFIGHRNAIKGHKRSLNENYVCGQHMPLGSVGCWILRAAPSSLISDTFFLFCC